MNIDFLTPFGYIRYIDFKRDSVRPSRFYRFDFYPQIVFLYSVFHLLSHIYIFVT